MYLLIYHIVYYLKKVSTGSLLIMKASLCYRLIDKAEVIYLEGKYYVVIYNNSLGFKMQ